MISLEKVFTVRCKIEWELYMEVSQMCDLQNT